MSDFTELRNKILFPENAASFLSSCIQVRDALSATAATGGKTEAAKAAAELAVDLRSFLINWKLTPYAEEGFFTASDIDAQSDAFLQLADDLGGNDMAQAARAEISSIAGSSMKKISEMFLSGESNTVWGHDYASGIIYSLRRGAAFSTNNPCKNTLFKQDFPEEYRAMLEDIVRNAPDASVEDKVSMLFMKICAINARALYPIFRCTGGKYGFFCIQANPFNIPNADSAEKIIAQIEFWHAAFKRELNTDEPNVVYKLPAVKSGVEAAKYLTKKGYRICVTLNFTVTQHEVFARIISEAKVPGFVVLMGGLLDDKVTAELKALGVEDAAYIGRHAAQAVIRKSYANLRAKGYDKYASIMTAAVRGPWAIANTFAPTGGATAYLTTLPAKIDEFDAEPLTLASTMDEPVDTGIMNGLTKSKVFLKAYATPSEQSWNWDDLFDFPPFVSFYDQFRNAYAEITQDVEALSARK